MEGWGQGSTAPWRRPEWPQPVAEDSLGGGKELARAVRLCGGLDVTEKGDGEISGITFEVDCSASGRMGSGGGGRNRRGGGQYTGDESLGWPRAVAGLQMWADVRHKHRS